MTKQGVKRWRWAFGSVTVLLLLAIWLIILFCILHDGPGNTGLEAKLQGVIYLLLFTAIGTGSAATYPF